MCLQTILWRDMNIRRNFFAKDKNHFGKDMSITIMILKISHITLKNSTLIRSFRTIHYYIDL